MVRKLLFGPQGVDLHGLLARALDWMVIVGSLFLLAFTPVAFGSVHPWAFRIAETAAFLLFSLWMLKLLILLAAEADFAVSIPAALQRLAVPLFLVLSLMSFQLIPLPPAVLRVISFPTYNLYERCIWGWPTRIDYSADPVTASGTVKSAGAEAKPIALGKNWRALSISPTLSRTSLLGGLAYVAFFLTIAFYPFGEGEKATLQKLIIGILTIGLVIAALGLIERFSWNGKVLWFFIPQDWGEPRLDVTRALGPFVNPDHFADYLGMIFPLAVAGVLFAWPFGSTTNSAWSRIFCATVLVVLAVAILLSLSRAVWAAIPLSLALFWSMVSSAFERTESPQAAALERARVKRRHPKPRLETTLAAALRVASNRWFVYGVALSVFAVALLAVVGGSARTEIDQRLGSTLQGDMSLVARLGLGRDTLRMIAGFPIAGVGLGSWAEIFPHFQSPPWAIYLETHAHNDYLEFVAETGLLCLVAMLWLGWRFIGHLRVAASSIQSRRWPWFAALVCGALVVGFHELFDFSLRTPANAFLLCSILGIAIRIGSVDWDETPTALAGKGKMYPCISAGLIGAPLFAFFAAGQKGIEFPVPPPVSANVAIQQILSYPTDAGSHLALANFDESKGSAAAMPEFEIATWLDPHNPYIRDAYARILFLAKRQNDADEQVRLSIMYSPDLNAHPYLTPKSIVFFSAKERGAVENGFKDAIRKGYSGSLDGLANFYALTDRYIDEARLYSTAVHTAKDTAEQERLLIAAADADNKAGNHDAAVKEFRAAIQLAPSDARPYSELISLLYGPEKDTPSAEATVEEGIRNGVDPVQLYSALADMAMAAKESKVAESALKKIINYAPTFENNVRLGEFYLAAGNPDDAVEAMRVATVVQPSRAEGYIFLATAQEAAYQYAEADRNYAYALSLEPNNRGLRAQYAAFRQKTADKSASLDNQPQ